ncbi:hypothetical protein J19TS1_19870 [Heyndrickxia oleronia]|nr:hypothetical protein J19TS1_19870 [Heyndrickxia oleronia]
MSKVEQLLKSINLFIKKAEEDDEEKLTDVVPDFPGLESIPDMVEEYEKKIASLLREQRKRFVNGIKGFTAKDNKETLEALLQYFLNDLFVADEFVDDFSDETADFLQMTIEELCKQLMESIDKDVAFDTLSLSTLKWISDWSSNLAEIMKLNTHEAVEKLLKEGIENGDSIQQIELKMKDLPQFDRKRARTTAITEVLTASSKAQWESYMQSPAVMGKKWKHSGSKKNTPRPAHVDLDGTVVGIDEKFDVNGHEADFPRDPSLPASERVNCHCVLGPVVDEDIIGLTKEEKEKLRQEALKELGEEDDINESELLPDYKNAQIPPQKLTSYALNKEHVKGGPKAVAFEKALGYTSDNYMDLINNVIENLPKFPATPKGDKGYGETYEVIMNLKGPNNKNANVLTAWIVDKDTNETRLTSIYVTDKGG